MESRLLNTRRTIRTNRNVLLTHKLAHHLPNDDEYHLSHRGRPRMAIRVHGRHCNPHEMRNWRNRTTTSRTPSTLHPSHASQTGTKRSIPKTRKMRLREERNRLPGCYRRQRSATNGSKEIKRGRRLARPS